jgi:type I restriction enzyme S subunit
MIKNKLPEEWEVKELGEVCQLVKKQYSPSKRDVRAYIGLEHIEQQNIRLINIGSTEDIDSNKFEFKAGQILFGKLRPYFRKVYRPKFDGVCSTDIWVIDSKGQFDNGFLFYFLADQRIINEASNSSEGTRMPRARWDYLSRLKFAFPTIGEQRAIASILSSLDDEIALNRSMNSTLEAIGQALFARWFVDFEFPDGEGKPYRSSGGEMVETELGDVPAGWRAGTLGELCDIIMGQSPPGTTYNEIGDGLPFYQGITDFGFRFPSRRVYCTAPTRFAEEGDVLLSVRAPVGSLNVADERCAIGRGVAALRLKGKQQGYLYYLLRATQSGGINLKLKERSLGQ